MSRVCKWPDGTLKSTGNAFTATGPSIYAKDAAKLGANRIGGTGKPPAKSHPLRNGTSSINTEKADRAGKTRKLTRSLS